MSGVLAEAVKNGQFVLTTECTPPRAVAFEGLKDCAKKLGASVHAICAPESEDGARLCSLAACSHIASSGAEPILHLLTRDLNRIALQSSILGAASMGVRNILCLTGRHQALTASGTARGVFDMDSVQLLRVADAIRKSGQLADGQTLDSPVELLLGTDTNPFAEPMELQVVTLEKAVSSGADFIMTQPVFNVEKFSKWMELIRERGIHTKTAIIASVMPLTSQQQGIELAVKLRYLDIPQEFIDQLPTNGNGRSAGAQIAGETAAKLARIDGVKGVHVMSGEDFELAAEVISTSGLSRS